MTALGETKLRFNFTLNDVTELMKRQDERVAGLLALLDEKDEQLDARADENAQLHILLASERIKTRRLGRKLAAANRRARSEEQFAEATYDFFGVGSAPQAVLEHGTIPPEQLERLRADWEAAFAPHPLPYFDQDTTNWGWASPRERRGPLRRLRDWLRGS